MSSCACTSGFFPMPLFCASWHTTSRLISSSRSMARVWSLSGMPRPALLLHQQILARARHGYAVDLGDVAAWPGRGLGLGGLFLGRLLLGWKGQLCQCQGLPARTARRKSSFSLLSFRFFRAARRDGERVDGVLHQARRARGRPCGGALPCSGRRSAPDTIDKAPVRAAAFAGSRHGRGAARSRRPDRAPAARALRGARGSSQPRSLLVFDVAREEQRLRDDEQRASGPCRRTA